MHGFCPARRIFNTDTMPIHRSEFLITISKEHHHALMLCWKIRTGLKKHIPVWRIQAYALWFYREHLMPHFEIEEQHIFTLMGKDNAHIKKALSDHQRLHDLFASKTFTEQHLHLIEKALDEHIRFEERILFNEIQETASHEALQQIQTLHADALFMDNLSDPFWVA